MTTLCFTDYEGMKLEEICTPLSAKTMPLSSRWTIGGMELQHKSAIMQQRVQVTKTYLRNIKRKKK